MSRGRRLRGSWRGQLWNDVEAKMEWYECEKGWLVTGRYGIECDKKVLVEALLWGSSFGLMGWCWCACLVRWLLHVSTNILSLVCFTAVYE
jgi:hypothetical protein